MNCPLCTSPHTHACRLSHGGFVCLHCDDCGEVVPHQGGAPLLSKAQRARTAIREGARVRLRADFLRSTGQYAGREPHSVWTVLRVDPHGIAVLDEDRDHVDATPAELAADPLLRKRRVAIANLERVRERVAAH